MSFFTDHPAPAGPTARYVVRLNTGTKQEPKYLYYAGYRTYPTTEDLQAMLEDKLPPPRLPAGPILLPDIKDAHQFEERAFADNMLGSDERLLGAEVVAI